MQNVDWLCVIVYTIATVGLGISVTRRAGADSSEFFGAGRNMTWWLLGMSMVATTFSTDTPNLVSDIVRTHGIAGNWLWWAYLLGAMSTAFIYAQLWRRAGVLTDVEFYELRYSGRSARFLRGFRALYIGIFLNTIVMATVILAAIKIAGVLLGLSPVQTVLITGFLTVLYSSLGGLRGIVITDFIHFIMAMAGTICVAYVALQQPEVGGLSGLLAHENVRDKLSILPNFSDPNAIMAILVFPLAVQWWATWYPGAEPGGGGYLAQRMLAARNEEHSMGAMFLFSVAHYAIRPWPWIIVALCSLVLFPDLDSMRAAFPGAADVIRNDMGYAVMLTYIPSGLLGFVVASLVAVFMSTISTLLNWGASYAIHDFYQRFVRPQSSEKEAVLAGRVCTVLLMVLAGFSALLMENALDSFEIILEIGAGTGLIFLLRWFWWRINAAAEIAAMVAATLAVIYLRFIHIHTGLPALDEAWMRLSLGIIVTTAAWVCVALFSRPTDPQVLREFYRLVYPGGPGWKPVHNELLAQGALPQRAATAWKVPQGLLCTMLGCAGVYSILFAIGNVLLGHQGWAVMFGGIALVSTGFLVQSWRSLLR